MIKLLSLSIVVLFELFIVLSASGQIKNEFIEVQKSIMITRDPISYGYPDNTKINWATPKEIQPFDTKEEIEDFLFHITTQKMQDLPAEIVSWMNQNLTSYSNDAALVFIRHPLVLNKLFNDNAAVVKKKFEDSCVVRNRVAASLKLYQDELNNNSSVLESNFKKIDSLSKESLTTPKKKAKNDALIKKMRVENAVLIDRINQLKPLLQSKQEQYAILVARFNELQKQYTDAKNFLVEDTSTVIMTVLSKENFEWSDYLLNKKNIMLVMVGGVQTFKSWKLTITNGRKQYQKEFSDLIRIVQEGAGVPMPTFKDNANPNCSPSEPETSKVPLTYVLLKRSRIDPPSSVELTTEKKVSHYVVNIHEKSYVGFKVGVSILDIDKKNFTLTPENQLTIKTDSLKPNDLKLNMMAMMELYPFGRDYDRLKPFWEKENIPFYERIGLVGGVRISKDPLETLFAGASFAISKSFNATIGFAFNKVAKDVDSLYVGPNTTLDYFQKNAGKEYKPLLYIGITVSPGQLLKVFGLGDKKED